MKQNKSSIFSMVMIAAVCYCGLLGILLTVSISTGVTPEQSEVKVNISSFKLPENNELEIDKVEEIADAEALSKKLLEDAKSTENVGRNNEALESLERSLLSGIALDVSRFTDIKVSDDTSVKEDKAILSALSSFGNVSFDERTGSTGKGKFDFGPPGAVRGDSVNYRLDANRRSKALQRYGGSKETEDALDKALKYLAAKQNQDGSWGGKNAQETGDIVALSSLSLLAFLGRGENYTSQYSDNVKRGVEFLIKCSETDNVEHVGKGFGHAILAYALAESYAVTGDIKLKPVLDKRIGKLINYQNSLGSYSINYDSSPVQPISEEELMKMPEAERVAARQIIVGEPTCDLSLLGWHMQALASAKTCGINVSNLDECLTNATGALIQVHQAKEGGFSQGVNAKRFEAEETMTPVGVLSLQLLGLNTSKPSRGALKYLYSSGSNKGNHSEGLKLPTPKWKGQNKNFPLYRWYYQTQMLFHFTEGKGELWESWNENLKKELTENQQENGSWVSTGDSFNLKNKDDLSCYTTSLASLMLEVYYRYLPGYSIKEAPDKEYEIARQFDAARMGILSKLSKGIDPDAAALLGAGIREIDPVQFAKFNGKPLQPADEPVKDEFSVYSSMRSTIQVKKTREFPQTLQPNQRIAIFLDEFLPEGFKWHMNCALAVSFERELVYQKAPPLQAIINGQTVLHSRLHEPHQLMNIFIPADKLKQFGNILEIRNNSDIPLCFDGARLESVNAEGEPLFFAAVDADKLPKDSQYLFNIGVIKLTNKDFDNINTELPLKGKLLVPETGSMFNRNSALWMLKSNIELIADKPTKVKFGEYYERLKILYGKKIEPMLDIRDITEKQLALVTTIFGPFVQYWRVNDCGDKDQTDKILSVSPGSYLLYDNVIYNLLAKNNQDSPKTNVLPNKTNDNSMILDSCVSQDIEKSEIYNEDDVLLKPEYAGCVNLPSFGEYRQTLMPLINSGEYIPNGKLWGALTCSGSERMGKGFQLYYLQKSGRQITEWFGSGACGLILDQIVQGGKYYDTLYRAPLPSLASMRMGAKLFEGVPRKLSCTYYPANDGEPLEYASCAASSNAPGVATIVASRRFPYSNEMEVMAYIPWNGETKITMTTGYLPKKSPYSGMAPPQNQKSFTVEIKNNIFKYTGAWYEMAVFRLIKSDNSTFRSNEPDIDWERKSSEYIVDRINASEEEAPKHLRTEVIRNCDNFYSVTGFNTSISVAPATMPNNETFYWRMPEEGTSTLVSFDFSKSMDITANNAYLTLHTKEKPDYIGFMVYPRLNSNGKTEKSANRIILRMMLGSQAILASVITNKWNHVTINANDLKSSRFSFLRIFPSFDNKYKGKSISYEINRIEYKFNSGIEYSRETTIIRDGYIVVIGKPRDSGVYHYVFNSVKYNIGTSTLMGTGDTGNLTSDISAINKYPTYSFLFPGNQTAEEYLQIEKYLSKEELQYLAQAKAENRELIPLVIKVNLVENEK